MWLPESIIIAEGNAAWSEILLSDRWFKFFPLKCWITALGLPYSSGRVSGLSDCSGGGCWEPVSFSFRPRNIKYRQHRSRHPYGSPCIGYTVAVPSESATARSLFFVPLIFVCNFLLLVADEINAGKSYMEYDVIFPLSWYSHHHAISGLH
jgi:hypothetical protein